MKSLIKIFVIFVFGSGMFSCSGGYSDDSYQPPAPIIVKFNATLDGASEVPPNASTAVGTATLFFNKTTKIFTLTVVYTGITPTDGHIHKGAIGVDGPVVFPLTSLTSPINYTSVALDAAQEADLMANLYYVNLHTAAFTGGEIRGQLITSSSSGGGGGGGGGGY